MGSIAPLTSLVTQSSNDTREKMLSRRSKFFEDCQAKLVDQLKTLNDQLQQEKVLRASVESQLTTAKETNQKLRGDIKQVQSQLYESTKPIRVTDDDFSTIIAQLGKFSGKVNNFPPNVKSHFTNKSKEELSRFFCELWDQDRVQIQALFEEKMDYGLVSVLVERYLIDKIVKHVLCPKSIHLDTEINKAFHQIVDVYVKTQHQDWIKDLRLKTAKATAELIQKKDPGTIKAIDQAKTALVQDMLNTLSFIYDTTQSDIQQRLEKLVDMASDLCLPMHGQEDVIEIYYLKTKDPVKQSQVKHVYRHLNQQDIFLSISPVFLAKSTVEAEDEVNPDTYLENHTLVYPGKAIW
ncbi:uncharacterized protein B0P05DRAFT_541951 [Gilbertella persicaria]|uniref:uncharacterized protein n=1 Tax=Gilbertella persicaria TaxID=101096 RepID=UPI00222006E4|nr:uncharacterized protein B0P05DRAFT_541951 [Gilbertella persicaria]KAI8078990.1 hypothetical protein B0P05DRAFT_541951 [Gilbertella persicaria]